MKVRSFIKVSCPDCQQSIEAPEELAGANINCPTCHVDFVLRKPPVKKDWTVTVTPRDPQSIPPYDPGWVGISHAANRVTLASIASFVACLFLLFVAFARAINNDEHWVTISAAAAGCLMIGFILQIIAQLMHIRATLERNAK